MKMASNPVFIISRTDSIGDVMLTLPLTGILKSNWPNCIVYFIGKQYTKDVIECCKHVDQFWDLEQIKLLTSANDVINLIGEEQYKSSILIHVFPNKDIAKWGMQTKIPVRIGTYSRLFHWSSCNKLVKLNRKNSKLHEAQLNVKLLSPIGVKNVFSLEELATYIGFASNSKLPAFAIELLKAKSKTVILHPSSQGSAKEWGLKNFRDLTNSLTNSETQVVITGTSADGDKLEHFFKETPNAINFTGKLSLAELITFISHCNALVAASTGPLHIAAACNIMAIGLYVNKRPMHPGRWAPIGAKAYAMVHDEDCENCNSNNDCSCIEQISPERIKALIVKNY